MLLGTIFTVKTGLQRAQRAANQAMPIGKTAPIIQYRRELKRNDERNFGVGNHYLYTNNSPDASGVFVDAIGSKFI